MGGGAPRELDSSGPVEANLDPDLSKKLDLALARLDALNTEFKQAREDERLSQLTKAWLAISAQMVEQLRHASMVLIQTHQISLETGSDGGGQGATPWIEEGGMAIPRLEFKLIDSRVKAISDGKVMAECEPRLDIPYEWIEKVVIKWILYSVQQATRQQG